MKKIFAVLCAAIMMFCLSATAFADGDILEFSYDQIDADVYEGVWCTIDEIIDMYLPANWNEFDLEKADLGENVVYGIFDDESGEHYMILQYFTADEVDEMYKGGFSTIDELAEELIAEGYEDAEVWYINDIETVVYTDEDNDMFNILILGDANGMFAVSFGPQSDEDYQGYFLNMMYSISVPEDAASEAA